LLGLGHPTLRYSELIKLLDPCEQRIWSIDLALALDSMGVKEVFMRSTLLGADPSHGQMTFYDNFDRDTRRVGLVFAEAQRRGMDVAQRHVPKEELVDLLRGGHVLLMLVDHRYLRCLSCDATLPPAIAGEDEFSGHFILVIGLLPPNSGSAAAAAASSSSAASVGSASDSDPVLQYLDPSARHSPCTCTLSVLERARRSIGTDEDLVAVSLVANQGRVPKLVRAPAVGLPDDEGKEEDDDCECDDHHSDEGNHDEA
jgi:hypothetical protein